MLTAISGDVGAALCAAVLLVAAASFAIYYAHARRTSDATASILAFLLVLAGGWFAIYLTGACWDSNSERCSRLDNLEPLLLGAGGLAILALVPARSSAARWAICGIALAALLALAVGTAYVTGSDA
jgi:hypothetical protein